MTPSLQFGVVGCGRMGARRGRTIAEHPETMLVAVADVDRERATGMAASLGCQALDDTAVFRHPDIDTVFVCTPNHMHVEHAVAALAHGKHVICEKPLACTPAEATAIVEAAHANSVTIKVGANLRYFSNVQKAHELLVMGSIGEPLSLWGRIGNDGWPTHSWFGDPSLSGGGAVLDLGCHLFDVARWFLGDAQHCIGTTRKLYWKVPVEDNGVGVFTTVSGRQAVIQASWTEWATYVSFDVYGTKGVISVTNGLLAVRTTLVRRGGATEVFDFDQTGESYSLELAAYVDARTAGVTPQPSGLDGMRVVEMADAVYRSARLGHSVAVASAPEAG